MIDPYNIPWPGCWCAECTRYQWDENYKKSIDEAKRRQFAAMRKCVDELVKSLKTKQKD